MMHRATDRRAAHIELWAWSEETSVGRIWYGWLLAHATVACVCSHTQAAAALASMQVVALGTPVWQGGVGSVEEAGGGWCSGFMAAQVRSSMVSCDRKQGEEKRRRKRERDRERREGVRVAARWSPELATPVAPRRCNGGGDLALGGARAGSGCGMNWVDGMN